MIEYCGDQESFSDSDHYVCNKRKGHDGMHGQKRESGGGYDATWGNKQELDPYAAYIRNEDDIMIHGPHHEIVKPFRGLPLVDKMRLAAEVLEEAGKRHPTGEPNFYWAPDQLRRVASNWEAEEAEKVEKDKLIKELAEVVRATGWTGDGSGWVAKAVIEAGWRKT